MAIGAEGLPRLEADRPLLAAAPSGSPTHTEVSLVNAAFLLVTSAWLAGQAPADAPPPAAEPAPAAAPAPAVAPAPAATTGGCCNGGYAGGYAGGYSGDCNSCCNSGGLFGGGRLRGLFSKHKGGDCCDSCGSTTCNTCA